MKKQNEVRYIITDVVSIPVIKLTSKTEAYRQATKPGWGAVEWFSAADGYKNPVNRDRSDKTQVLICWEDESVDMYTKNGGYFGFSGNDDIDTREIPKQAECAAIIHSDSCGFDFWAEDGAIKIFVTYDGNGLIDTYRLGYGNEQPEEGETELSFEDLYKVEGDEWDRSYREEIPGTMEYQRKQEAAAAENQPAAPSWMTKAQQEDFRQICNMIDTIKSGRDFYRVMSRINCGNYSVDVINAAREFKKCFNSAQYEPQPDKPDAAADNQQSEGTAAEAASEGRETALGTPETMAGTDATEAARGPQAAPQAGEINLGKLCAVTRPKAGGGLRVIKPPP